VWGRRRFLRKRLDHPNFNQTTHATTHDCQMGTLQRAAITHVQSRRLTLKTPYRNFQLRSHLYCSTARCCVHAACRLVRRVRSVALARVAAHGSTEAGSCPATDSDPVYGLVVCISTAAFLVCVCNVARGTPRLRAWRRRSATSMCKAGQFLSLRHRVFLAALPLPLSLFRSVSICVISSLCRSSRI
jgi:hypothetical protein